MMSYSWLSFICTLLTLFAAPLSLAAQAPAAPAVNPIASSFVYDRGASESARLAGDQFLQSRDAAQAIRKYQEAIMLWPVNGQAWARLEEVETEQGTKDEADHARFFAGRVEWIKALHPRAAAAALRPLRDGKLDTPEGKNPRYRTTAGAFVAFLEDADAVLKAENRAAQPQETALQRLGLIPAAAATGGLGYLIFILVKR